MQETQATSELVSVAEAARIAGVSYVHIWRLIQRGEVPAIRVGKGHAPIRIPRERFVHWLYHEKEMT